MDSEVRPTPTDITPLLGVPRAQHARWARLSLIAVTTAAFMLTAGWYFRGREPAVRYLTAPVTSGSLTVTVTATGNFQPRNQVEIGSEISGTVRTVNVDVNDPVRAGQVLAELDTARLQAQLLQARSAIASAEARVLQADASLKEATANQSRLLKVRKLSGNRLPAQQHLDLAEAAVAHAQGEAAAGRAAVAQARANRSTLEADLSKADIRAPIDGVVLVRSIEPGQTVAASLQAPVMFILAEDLRELELHVALDEADVASVRDGQTATFTVDAYPDRKFEARITRIHLASNNTRTPATAAVSQYTNLRPNGSTGVVTYETVLEVVNPELLLRPGMTATAEIVTSHISGAILVPNAAMRFTPQHAKFPGMEDDSQRRAGIAALMPYLAERWQCPRQDGQALGCVWALVSGEPALAIFKPGATDRSMTQVLELERLPNWGSLSRLRDDSVLARATRLKLTPGIQVIVDSEQDARD